MLLSAVAIGGLGIGFHSAGSGCTAMEGMVGGNPRPDTASSGNAWSPYDLHVLRRQQRCDCSAIRTKNVANHPSKNSRHLTSVETPAAFALDQLRHAIQDVR